MCVTFFPLSACLISQFKLIQKSLLCFRKLVCSVSSFKRTFIFYETGVKSRRRRARGEGGRRCGIIVLVIGILRTRLRFISTVCAHIALRMALIIRVVVVVHTSVETTIASSAAATVAASSARRWATPVVRIAMGSVWAGTGGRTTSPGGRTFETTTVWMVSVHFFFGSKCCLELVL